MKAKILISGFICILLVAQLVHCLDNGVGLTPPMGWNSWNHFWCGINENLIKETTDALISTGLAAAGYQFVNLDDCWQLYRDENGMIHPDPQAFPSGMKALGDYIHSKGLKFGVYSDAGFKTCQGRPGSLGYETIDAQTYASWGVDYLKYDNCNNDGTKPEVRYPVMRDALNKTGRPIFYSMCEWGIDNPATWAPKVSNSWRTTGDIEDKWSSIMSILDQQVGITQYAGPGGWNDPDMLEVGNGGCTTTEYISHFSLWAILKAPLLIGCDVRKIDNVTLSILSNKEVIAINQDPLGKSASRVQVTPGHNGNLEVWAGPVVGGFAAVLLNRGDKQATITASLSTIGFPPSVKSAMVRDLWEHRNLGKFTNSFSANVVPHGVVMVKLTPQ